MAAYDLEKSLHGFSQVLQNRMRFCMLLSRPSMGFLLVGKKEIIPPWIFCGIGDLQANLRGAKPRLHALFTVWQERGKKKRSLSQSKGTVPKEMNCPQRKKSELDRWDAGKKQGVETATKKSVHGFFCGLQNRYAILHVTKLPSLARYCMARKKSLSCFFYTDVKKNWGS